MIRLANRIRTSLRYDPVRLGVLLRLSGFLGLPATIRTLLLRLVVRMRFLVVVATLTTEKVEDFLSVGTAHVSSFRSWRAVVKRSTVVSYGAH